MDTFEELKTLFERQIPPLEVIKQESSPKKLIEFGSTKEAEVLGKTKDEVYFGAVIVQKDYVGFYFQPIYTHPDHFKLSENLGKLLKGKSCFHIKNLNSPIKKELERLVRKGLQIYIEENWIRE